MPDLMTFSQYARHRGVTRAAVAKAVSSGRISVIPSAGKTLIDPRVADLQWQTRQTLRQGPIVTPPMGDEPSGGYDGPAARAKREFHEANLAAMREAKEAGRLVDRDRVVKLATDAGATCRAALERLPGLSLELAAMSDADAIRVVLVAKVEEILGDLVHDLSAMASPNDLAEEEPA